MSEQLEVLKSVAKRLDAAGVPYMISGSVAMNFYAQPRMTRDIDIIVALTPRDARRLRELFEAEFYLDEEDIRDAVAQRGSFNAIHNASLVKLDFIVRKETPYRRAELERGRTIAMEGCPVRVVAPEDLVLSKLAWAKEGASELQMRDVRNILDSCADLDRDYMKRWAAEIGVGELLERALAGET